MPAVKWKKIKVGIRAIPKYEKGGEQQQDPADVDVSSVTGVP